MISHATIRFNKKTSHMHYIQQFTGLFFVLILPGLAVLAWLKHDGQDFAEQLASCIGLSISITALLFLLTFYFQFQISNNLLTLYFILCSLICMAGWLHHKIKPHWSVEIPITLGLLAVVLVLRFIQVEDLLLPAWVDSVHHVLITRIISETRSIPPSLDPFLPVPFSYYFGFHGLAALYSVISGLAPEKAVLLLGQVLNACVPLAIYRLGRVFWEQREKALIAAILVAFVSQMPAYYVSWGRYTLLTGMFMLSLAISFFIDRTPTRSSRSTLVMLGLIVSGTFISHYFTGLLFALFVVTHFFFLGIQSRVESRREILWQVITLVAAMIPLIPWLLRAFNLSGFTLETSIILPSTSSEWKSIQTYSSYLLRLSAPLRNQIFLTLGILGVIPLFLSKKTRSLSVWALLLVFFSLPIGLDLPNIRPDHVAIVLFLPLSLSTTQVIRAVPEYFRLPNTTCQIIRMITRLLVCTWSIWGIIESLSIINPATIIVTSSDMTAIAWIKQNLPVNSTFLINTTHWQSGIYRGVDGGYWLLPLTGLNTLPPPVVYSWGDSSEVRHLNSLSAEISTLNSCDETFSRLLIENGVTHIYTHRGNWALQSSWLDACTKVDRIYQADDISLYQVVH